MGDGVVQVAGDAQPILGHAAPRLRFAGLLRTYGSLGDRVDVRPVRPVRVARGRGERDGHGEQDGARIEHAADGAQQADADEDHGGDGGGDEGGAPIVPRGDREHRDGARDHETRSEYARERGDAEQRDAHREHRNRPATPERHREGARHSRDHADQIAGLHGRLGIPGERRRQTTNRPRRHRRPKPAGSATGGRRAGASARSCTQLGPDRRRAHQPHAASVVPQPHYAEVSTPGGCAGRGARRA